MAKAKPVYVNGQLFYPVSIFDVIVNPTTRRTLTQTLALINTAIEKKVDKEEGKELSSNDFTDALKTKLDTLNNYDDSSITARVLALEEWKNVMTGKSADDIINTFKEIEEFLEGITDTSSLAAMLSDLKTEILTEVESKEYVDTTQLSTAIATALTPYVKESELATVAKTGNYNDLSNKPVIDTAMSDSSSNAVGNKVVKAALDLKADASEAVTTGESSATDYPDVTSLIL